jgi:2-oxoglutarate dehydrogenase E2 component (dihydrolipoamide succinyltransferase)
VVSAAVTKDEKPASKGSAHASPSARKLAHELEVDTAKVQGSGKHGNVTKEDVKSAVMQPAASQPFPADPAGERAEQRVPMTRIRQRIAERLLQSQANAAILTTFNEVNMQPVMDLRARYKDSFEKKHGVKLGFSSFFVKAAVHALRKFPVVNASVDGTDVIYHGYFDIGVAIGSERGLVVPILRDADKMSFADIERRITDYASRAKDGKIGMDELSGGTFSITNGGVFGSLISTPILNPPQSAILGMHGINERLLDVELNDDGTVKRLRKGKMMYLALTYDHRIIDGREAVLFLRTIKECLEDPARLLLNL